ncbi:MAG: C39 family peptidase [Bacteroidota bacterium]
MKKIINFIFALIFTISISAQDTRVLNVPYIYQVHLCCWCWAASTNSVIQYYGSDESLCEVVEYARSQNPSRFGTQNCCNTPTPNACINTNYWTGAGSVCDILDHYGISNNDIMSSLAFNTVRSEINAGRPIVFGWLWNGGGGHVLTLRGYDQPSTSVYYIDPSDGYHIASYAWVVNDGTHTWGATSQLITTPSCSDANSLFTESINSDLNYEETNTIEINSTINNADVEFRCGNRFTINPGFKVNDGSTFIIETDENLLCE